MYRVPNNTISSCANFVEPTINGITLKQEK